MTINIPRHIVCFMIFSIAISCGGIDSKIELFKTFGQDEFSSEKWASGDPLARGRMVYRYLKGRSPLNRLSAERIRNELGENTAYYLYDHFPAYYVGPTPPGIKLPGYLFAFVVDHTTGIVTDIHLEPNL